MTNQHTPQHSQHSTTLTTPAPSGNLHSSTAPQHHTSAQHLHSTSRLLSSSHCVGRGGRMVLLLKIHTLDRGGVLSYAMCCIFYSPYRNMFKLEINKLEISTLPHALRTMQHFFNCISKLIFCKWN